MLSSQLGQDARALLLGTLGRVRHPAKLNFDDTMSYAVAAVADRPLLFTGRDFEKTDIMIV